MLFQCNNSAHAHPVECVTRSGSLSTFAARRAGINGRVQLVKLASTLQLVTQQQLQALRSG